MTKPITPEEILVAHIKAKIASIPTFVIEIVNSLITDNYNPRAKSSIVYQNDILSKLDLCVTDRDEIFEKGWLDFEENFRSYGWKVEYFKPPYYDDSDPYFKFSH